MGLIYASIVSGKLASKLEKHLACVAGLPGGKKMRRLTPFLSSGFVQTRTSLGYSFCTFTGGQRPNETFIFIAPMRLAGKPVFHAGTVCIPRASYNARQTNPRNERAMGLMVRTVARTMPAVYCSTSFARRRVVVRGAIADRVPKASWPECTRLTAAEWCQTGAAGCQSGCTRRCPSSQR